MTVCTYVSIAQWSKGEFTELRLKYSQIQSTLNFFYRFMFTLGILISK